MREEDGDLVLVDGEEEQGCRPVVEIGKVGAFEGGVGGKCGGVGEVEAEGETALEPGFDGMAVGGEDLWGAALDSVARCWSRSSAARVSVGWSCRQPRNEMARRIAAARAD